MSAGGLTSLHVIVVLWFEVAVLCSELLLYIVLGRVGGGLRQSEGRYTQRKVSHPSLNTALSFHIEEG